ncbi:hypothetical protein [Yersinia phage fHe-Yen9-04]|uniref:Uncharacterized protein n=2 Tax=Eneladusvirus Yen904 TaxID=2560849 RepID=A0A2C9CXC7_9CAUD|nr:hypothetical protein FDJ41_gp196 [Yersinia phage fHe-Yen9-04]SOK58473.1 hypothetical protein [Yersinia phage fHe-Yen9-04]SOK59008.1 hypothetical protein [Yersinia phage fHe-Yen9-03]VUE36242.1 hypothetical protein [Yersinia phage fHe-Yen9-04]
MGLLDKYGIELKSMEEIVEPQVSYRFICMVSNLDISLYVNKIDIKFINGKTHITIVLREIDKDSNFNKILKYSKNTKGEVITIQMLDKNNELSNECIINNFKITEISLTDLDYSKATSVSVSFTCVGDYHNITE